MDWGAHKRERTCHCWRHQGNDWEEDDGASQKAYEAIDRHDNERGQEGLQDVRRKWR